MTRWTHGHSVAGGVLLAVALERHWLLVLVLTFATGVAAGRAWGAVRRLPTLLLEIFGRGERSSERSVATPARRDLR